MSVPGPMRWRVIEEAPVDGFRNMAVDEALLESCAGGAEGFPCLRLYGFRPPCLSLGFSQEHARAVDLAFCRESGIDVVRRPTGGRAVLHDVELTYAVVARYGAGPFGAGVLATYEAISRALIAAFALLGVESAVTEEAESDASPRGEPVCFAEPSRHEIAARGFKIAGSAQARRRGSFLQHGSLPIQVDVDRLAGATGLPRGAGGARRLPDLKGLAQILGRPLDPSEVARAIRGGFERTFRGEFAAGGLAPGERERAEWLRAHRYLTAAWTFRR